MLCVILSSVSFVITIFTESYSNPCALCIETAYATWNGTTFESSSSSLFLNLLTLNEIIELPDADSPISLKSYPEASNSLIASSSSISNHVRSFSGWIPIILPFELLWINGEKTFDSLNKIGSPTL